MQNLILVLIFIAITKISSAQNYIDLANVNYTVSPSTGDTNAAYTKQGAHFQIPIVLKNKDVIMTGIGGAITTISNSFDNINYNQSLSNLIVLLGYQKKINDKLSWLGLVLNQINSDVESFSIKYYQPGFYTVFTIKKSERLKYKIGALYKYEFSGPFVIPLFGVDWQVNDKLQVFGTLPITANVIYKPIDKLGLGLAFKGSIATYGVNSDIIETYIQENNNEIHALIDCYVTNRFVVQARVGYQADNKYRQYFPDDKVNASMGPVILGDKRMPISRIYGDGLSCKFSFIYRFSLK